MRKTSGFTLIELLVVVTIITILSVVGLVSFQNVRQKALDAKMKADIDSIKKAYETNFNPSLNDGQGGYRALQDSDFASGKIPTQPDGAPYPCAIGPDAGCSINGRSDGYKVSATLSDGTTYAATSTGGTLAGDANLSSCDVLGTLNTGLAAYWKMDETSGNSVADWQNSSLNGTTDSTQITTGKFNNARQFVFQNYIVGGGYIDMGDSTLLNPSDAMSVAAWIKPGNDNGGRSSAYQIISRSNGSKDPYQFYRQSNDGSVHWAIWNTAGTNYNAASAAGVAPLNNWIHVVGVFNGSANTLKVYVNGSQSGSTVTTTGAIRQSDIKTRIGTLPVYSGTNYFIGIIDDVRMYNRALSDQEINLMYSNGSGCSPSP